MDCVIPTESAGDEARACEQQCEDDNALDHARTASTILRTTSSIVMSLVSINRYE
jgi:hypothetical protein